MFHKNGSTVTIAKLLFQNVPVTLRVLVNSAVTSAQFYNFCRNFKKREPRLIFRLPRLSYAYFILLMVTACWRTFGQNIQRFDLYKICISKSFNIVFYDSINLVFSIQQAQMPIVAFRTDYCNSFDNYYH